ncbi:hypothetical protein EJ08DRAFT_191739 [Tothia fuscella]|uniref:Uncharacterized protein n=1 Tax=Tothia fuscella TaxID=1048955 RepID=A0A9P4NU21_9PEZI|nr:hypothetical protein EJ08DRAFT_191739 [Tothia fuscella]
MNMPTLASVRHTARTLSQRASDLLVAGELKQTTLPYQLKGVPSELTLSSGRARKIEKLRKRNYQNSPLLHLPIELLLDIDDLLPDGSKLIFRTISRDLRLNLGRAPKITSFKVWKYYGAMLEFDMACELELDPDLLETMRCWYCQSRICSWCKEYHHKARFTAEQLDGLPQQRVCIGADGYVGQSKDKALGFAQAIAGSVFDAQLEHREENSFRQWNLGPEASYIPSEHTYYNEVSDSVSTSFVSNFLLCVTEFADFEANMRRAPFPNRSQLENSVCPHLRDFIAGIRNPWLFDNQLGPPLTLNWATHHMRESCTKCKATVKLRWVWTVPNGTRVQTQRSMVGKGIYWKVYMASPTRPTPGWTQIVVYLSARRDILMDEFDSASLSARRAWAEATNWVEETGPDGEKSLVPLDQKKTQSYFQW